MIDRVFERSFPLINFIITSRGRWTRFTNDRGRGGNIEQGEGKEWSRVGQVWSRVSWGKVTKYILQRWCHPSTLPSSSLPPSLLISSTFFSHARFRVENNLLQQKMIDSPPPLEQDNFYFLNCWINLQKGIRKSV